MDNRLRPWFLGPRLSPQYAGGSGSCGSVSSHIVNVLSKRRKLKTPVADVGLRGQLIVLCEHIHLLFVKRNNSLVYRIWLRLERRSVATLLSSTRYVQD